MRIIQYSFTKIIMKSKEEIETELDKLLTISIKLDTKFFECPKKKRKQRKKIQWLKDCNSSKICLLYWILETKFN